MDLGLSADTGSRSSPAGWRPLSYLPTSAALQLPQRAAALDAAEELQARLARVQLSSAGCAGANSTYYVAEVPTIGFGTAIEHLSNYLSVATHNQVKRHTQQDGAAQGRGRLRLPARPICGAALREVHVFDVPSRCVSPHADASVPEPPSTCISLPFLFCSLFCSLFCLARRSNWCSVRTHSQHGPRSESSAASSALSAASSPSPAAAPRPQPRPPPTLPWAIPRPESACGAEAPSTATARPHSDAGASARPSPVSGSGGGCQFPASSDSAHCGARASW